MKKTLSILLTLCMALALFACAAPAAGPAADAPATEAPAAEAPAEPTAASGETVTVTFDLNYEGAKKRITTEEIDAGSSILREDPIRQNYDFIGWFLDAACTLPLGGGKAEAGSGTISGGMLTYAMSAAMGINHVVCEIGADGALTLVDITSPDMGDTSVLSFYKEEEKSAALSEAQAWYDANGEAASVDSADAAPNNGISEDTTLYAGWQSWDDATIAMMTACLEEVTEGVKITSRPYAYDADWFEQYSQAVTPLIFLTHGGAVIPEAMSGLIDMSRTLRENVILADGVSDPEDTVWYIWDDAMPEAADAAEYDYYGYLDEEGYRPFLTPHLQADQSTVKGNIILISGGGYYFRTNRWEAFPTADAFYELGYNVYILQRRVEPSLPIDSSLDLQRAIRYIRYHADALGIGRPEDIACCGFSGGGGTIQGAVEQLYGDIQPTRIYPDYACDEIDAVNSDMSAMLMVYSATTLQTDNPNIPDAFVVQGADDPLFSAETLYGAIASYVELGVRYEQVVFSDAGHGFGCGFGLNSATYADEDIANVKVWPSLADTFLQITFGDLVNITAADGTGTGDTLGTLSEDGATYTYRTILNGYEDDIICSVGADGVLTLVDITSPSAANMSVMVYMTEEQIAEALQIAQDAYDQDFGA
ncbi:MAG: hypothetical protein Q4C13_01145 [Clostridia bacterium]|nr:hypothetical protein [Clostridia bacterium]